MKGNEKGGKGDEREGVKGYIKSEGWFPLRLVVNPSFYPAAV